MEFSLPARRGPSVLAVLLCVAALACQDNPAGPDVSEPEIWRLELEQVNDGGANLFQQRGTINLQLRLNHTTTPDPACANRPDPNATTFVASVEAIPSRLQPPATGSANGTWNCFGFSAEVRLDNGTIYTLTSTQLRFLPDDSITVDTPMQPNAWRAGSRSGYFLFGREDSFDYMPFDSHIDLSVQNRHGYDVSVVLGGGQFHHRDVGYEYFDSFDPVARGDTVLVGRTRTLSWPLFPGHRWTSGQPALSSYAIYVGEGLGGLQWESPGISHIRCFLGPQRRDVVELIVHDGLRLECGTGWLGGMDFRVTPGRLFLWRGETDTLIVNANPADTVFVENNAAEILTSLWRTTTAGNSQLDFFDGKLAVTAAANAPRREHGVTVRSHHDESGQDGLIVVPVEVYDLQVDAIPATVGVAPGGSGTVAIRLARSGLVGLNVRLSVPILPPGVFLTPPSFSPGVTQGDSSTLTLRADHAAPPGDYPLVICATIVGDPKARCHSAQTTLRVLAASACTSPQAWYPLNGVGMDASGNNNHGTVQGATPVANRHGDPQAALAFDGTDDAVQLGDRFNTLTLPFSIAVWVYRPAAAGQGLRAIFVTDDEPGRYAGIWFQTDGPGQPSITFADGGGTSAAFRRTFTANSAIPSDTWVHLAATARGPTDLTLYVNGAAVPGTYSGTGGPLVHTPAPARIGRITILPANQPWLGRLDELRIYNCSLDSTEVAALHALR